MPHIPFALSLSSVPQSVWQVAARLIFVLSGVLIWSQITSYSLTQKKIVSAEAFIMLLKKKVILLLSFLS